MLVYSASSLSIHRRTVSWCGLHASQMLRAHVSTRCRCSVGVVASATSATVSVPFGVGGSSQWNDSRPAKTSVQVPSASRVRTIFEHEAKGYQMYRNRLDRAALRNARMLNRVCVHGHLMQTRVIRVLVFAGQHLAVESPASR